MLLRRAVRRRRSAERHPVLKLIVHGCNILLQLIVLGQKYITSRLLGGFVSLHFLNLLKQISCSINLVRPCLVILYDLFSSFLLALAFFHTWEKRDLKDLVREDIIIEELVDFSDLLFAHLVRHGDHHERVAGLHDILAHVNLRQICDTITRWSDISRFPAVWGQTYLPRFYDEACSTILIDVCRLINFTKIFCNLHQSWGFGVLGFWGFGEHRKLVRACKAIKSF